jgi:hypothetical protein
MCSPSRLRRLTPFAIWILTFDAAARPPVRAADEASTAGKGWFGLYAEPVQQLGAAQRRELAVAEDAGSVVTVVVANGPADVAGLRPGDLLLSIGGRAVPDFHPTGADDAARRSEWHASLRARLEASVPGEKTSFVIRRAGRRITLDLVASTSAERIRVQGGTVAPFPPPTDAGEARSFSATFERPADGAPLPEGFRAHQGGWRIADGPAGAGDSVLRQDRATLPWAVVLATGAGRAVRDGAASVRVMPLSGIADQSGGIVFRARDPENCYVVRLNAIEDNFRLYVVKDGTRSTLADLKVVPPAANAWHTLEVTFTGDTMRATFDGKNEIEAKDATFASGWCGLWTKADSVTLFDDLKVTPASATK